MKEHVMKLSTSILLVMLCAVTSFSWADQLSANTEQQAQQIMMINVNSASVDELATLKGIGKVKALAIVQFRDAHGGFKSLEDLLQIPGIGEKVLQQNLARLSL
jgi:competence protein ComEA